jgi:hypothetical protein
VGGGLVCWWVLLGLAVLCLYGLLELLVGCVSITGGPACRYTCDRLYRNQKKIKL